MVRLTDRRTDRRTDGRHTIKRPKFHYGRIIKKKKKKKNPKSKNKKKIVSVTSWLSTCFCVVLCVNFCTGHFAMVPLNLTYLHCL